MVSKTLTYFVRLFMPPAGRRTGAVNGSILGVK